jgi:hypothetical protein
MLSNGKVNMAQYSTVESVLSARETWERMYEKLRTGEMPPKPMPSPKPNDVAAVTQWIETLFDRVDRVTPPDPGRVTARRLNRYEYNNTVRDLFGVDFRPAEDFPVDDSGYGFDNVGDVLTVSPVLLEKYLAAAEQVARRTLFADPPPPPTRRRVQSPSKRARHEFPAGAEYSIRVGIPGRENGPILLVFLDGVQIGDFIVETGEGKPRSFETRLPVQRGPHTVTASLPVDYVEIRGPFNPTPAAPPASRTRILTCSPEQDPDCAGRIVASLARRAWRRPVSSAETGSLLRFARLAQSEGEPFDRGIQLALQAILVAPHFLFRIERDPDPGDPSKVHLISQHELATRLSYFLWSSTPDEQLDALADNGHLRRPGVLEAQAKRLLADPKSWSLIENFAGQWLQLRNLDSIQPDPDRFPSFNEDLRRAMIGETQQFLKSIIQEDRSVLDLLDARYSYLNETLARHYGIEGIAGPELRRVTLETPQRGGLLTHSSVLSLSSYPTRTSPVLRGKWVLENILNAPPPPPPAVNNLDEDQIGVSGTLRQQFEKHRANPVCASCHARMDPLGFGLENYDAIGRWRTMDGKFPVDSSGTLPNGKSFRTPAELMQLLRADEKDAFVRGLVEKLLVYGLGRGLESYDRPAVKWITSRLAAGDYKFSTLIREIVLSTPFQMRRGDPKR